MLSKLVSHDESDSSGPVVGATLELLPFVLAFTFNMASNRYNARKQPLLDEVNAIGTAYLRADLIAQPFRDQAKALLRRYVDPHVELVEKPHLLVKVVDIGRISTAVMVAGAAF